MTSDLQSRLLSDFELLESNLNGLTGTLRQRRTWSMDSFKKLGFPTIRHEEWKYTNVMPLVSREYQSQFSPVEDIESIEEYLIPGFTGNVICFINGRYSAKHSRRVTKDSNVLIGSLHEELSADNSIDFIWGRGIMADPEANAFTALNTAFINDGLFVVIPPNVCVEESTYVLYINDARTANTVVQPRNYFLLCENSQAKFVSRVISIGEHSSLTNMVSECSVSENAVAEFITIQDDNNKASLIHTWVGDQQANSNIKFVTVSLSGEIIRNTVSARLIGQNAEAHMYGVYFTNGTTLVDNHTVMDHTVPNCHSNELFKGIVDDASQGVFNGKIFVRKDAQKTLAYQSNRNIVLDERAKVNTKPQLEIFADDVKCSHGCTVGQLDEESLFYLRSRGISESNAKALLLTAFAEDITSQISIDAVREFVNAKIEARLVVE